VSRADKAIRLLTERRLCLLRHDQDVTVAVVLGDHGIHTVERTPRGWGCSCAAWGDCSHVLAVRSVTVAGPPIRSKLKERAQ
jgi:hypothetical protein